MSLHPNHAFLLDRMRSAQGRVLDFGCGAGELVEAARSEGLDVWGADVFYADGSDRGRVDARRLLGHVVREIADGVAPFPDGWFNLIVTNQVLEHVQDLQQVIADWQRLLQPGGVVVALYPTRETVREPHVGVPLLHRLPPGRGRVRYAALVRQLGFGYHHDGLSAMEWAERSVAWVDEHTVYRRGRAIRAEMGRYFDVRSIAPDLIAWRLGGERRSTSRMGRWALDMAGQPALRWLAGEAIEAVRRPT